MTAQPEATRELHVSHVGGPAFRIAVRGHQFVVDQPVGGSVGGADAGPTPTELFVASLAACAAFYGHAYLARRGLPDRVDVSVRWLMGSKPDRVSRVELLVDAPGVPPTRIDVFRRVVEGCLVHNTLTNPPNIEIQMSRPRRDQQPQRAEEA